MNQLFSNNQHSAALAAPFETGLWNFDLDTKENVTKDWLCTVKEIEILADLGQRLLHTDFVKINITTTDHYDGFVSYHLKNTSITTLSESLAKAFDHYDNILTVQVTFKGDCTLEDKSTVYCDLFSFEIQQNDPFSMIISTNNISFLPNNPLLGLKHYELWKNNAVRLGKLLKKFDQNSEFRLVDPGVFNKNLSPTETPYFFGNGVISNYHDDETDEFHVPFELLDKEDYAFFFGENS